MEHSLHGVVDGPARVYIGHVLAVATIPLTTVTPDLIVLDVAGFPPGTNALAVPLDQVGMLSSYNVTGKRCDAFSNDYGSCEHATHAHQPPCHFGLEHGNHLGSWYA